jgi:hypothetical protein
MILICMYIHMFYGRIVSLLSQAELDPSEESAPSMPFCPRKRSDICMYMHMSA